MKTLAEYKELDGSVCIKCDSDNLICDLPEPYTGVDVVRCIECEDCGQVWEEYYSLDEIVPLENI